MTVSALFSDQQREAVLVAEIDFVSNVTVSRQYNRWATGANS